VRIKHPHFYLFVEWKFIRKYLHVQTLLDTSCIKVKLSLVFNKVPYHAKVGGTGGIVPCILNFSTKIATLTPRKESQYSRDRRLGGPHSPSGLCGKEKNPSLWGIKIQLSNPLPSHYTDRYHGSIDKSCIYILIKLRFLGIQNPIRLF
jgi:hypothetical protein